MKIKAAVSHKEKLDLKIEDVELQDPKQDEVLIRIVASGVCHTDAESMNGRGTPFPSVLGHEGSGIVEKIGSNVKNLEPGDHVVLSFAYWGPVRKMRIYNVKEYTQFYAKCRTNQPSENIATSTICSPA